MTATTRHQNIQNQFYAGKKKNSLATSFVFIMHKMGIMSIKSNSAKDEEERASTIDI
jgi:ATP-dependent phosphoenolpyruvate carboxykinase